MAAFKKRNIVTSTCLSFPPKNAWLSCGANARNSAKSYLRQAANRMWLRQCEKMTQNKASSMASSCWGRGAPLQQVADECGGDDASRL